ncbi:aldehyde dehydrogenase family protein [Pseudarthrobacter sp. NIBRBAC000502770]|uniref:aldehyde dehydrogenase family protein n=1 Tax=Pseudarthrobacter sp. NIBRBAC000502770 TaxID=2590785 RepID=UPI0011408647|nr:aldehyde dehydrogenase family protein [Pseudarthrobacter sp. NIBRBAC000502770]QDG90231.1 aldehyde dehydrogenase family protein [Pseudarthrobacter sp. NIBRBAC000502770]
MTATQYEVHDPATLELVGHAPENTAQDVEAAVAAARAASAGWAADREARRNSLLAGAALIRRDLDALATLLSREQGKPKAEAAGEFSVAAGLFEYYADLEWDSEQQLSPRADRSLEVQYRPVGIVGTITPWNFPISLLCVKLAPALVAGCTVVAKPSPSTPLSTIALVNLLNEALPAGVLQVRTSSRRTVNVALSTSPGIRKISFTGSTEVGISIAQQAASTVKRVTMELGGNDPAIVLDDADIAVTARGIVGSAFRNAGQVCMAVKRVYVPRSRSAELAEAIAVEAARHVLGHGIADGTTMGPMHNESQLKLVHGLVDSAVGAGARILSGGTADCDLPGYFLSPTVVIDAEPGMDLVEHEQFGAALPIVAYDSLDDTIAGLNAGEFGLGASVWSQDQERAYATASRIDAGTVWVNQHTVVEPDAPFGGWKASGVGRERGRWGLEEYLETRVINARPHA